MDKENTKSILKNTLDIKKLFHPSLRNDLLHPTRFLYAVIFATLFVVLGYFIPRVYSQYFANYYSVQQPVTVDKETYKPCSALVVTAIRTSAVNMSVHATIQIYLVTVSGDIVKRAPLYDGNIIVEKTKDAIVHLTYTLPCDLATGKYYLKAVIDYPVYDIKKTYMWITNVFTVDKNSTE